MILHLIRFNYGPDCVEGQLKFPVLDDGTNKYNLWTLERAWDGMNTPFLSAIPDGTYPLIAFDSPKHPATWIVTPVPGRTHILLHPGNQVEDSRGCILPGLTRDPSKVWNSRDAMDLLNYVLNRNEQHTIVIGSGMGAKWEPPNDIKAADSESDSGNGSPSGDMAARPIR